METTRKTDKNGVTIGTNWMLDEIIDLFEAKGMNNGDNDDLIKKIACQKMDYGRSIAIEVAVRGDALTEANKLNEALKEQIVKLGGEPKKIHEW
jgi:hypothetical protein